MQDKILIAGRDLDMLVAEKVMGWKHVGRSRSLQHDFVGHAEENVLLPIPHYSTDIAAAWAILDVKLGERTDWQSDDIDAKLPVKITAVIKIEDGRWMARFDSPIHGNEMPGYYERSCYQREDAEFAVGVTAPHAICLAALAAINSQSHP